MAQNSITIQLTVDDKGTLRQVSKEADKARKGYDGVAKSSAEADRNIKGAARASSNGTKNFSKMQQGLMRGLVPAYATLAANLFAVSAAFNFLRQASDFQRLLEGQEALTMATGIAYESLATSIQKATDSQITFTEASRSAAIGISAGLSADQLIGLSEAANTVSRVLGRDLVDSYNRLIRGVTKAEPELLDELGIILRLDDANKRYADSLGLVASELTPYQRSQAVTNEVLRQVEERYGKVNEILDPTGAALNKLAVSFESLTKKLGTALVGPANFIADVLNENIIAATSVLGLFAASILNSVIPSISDLSEESGALEKGIKSLQDGIDDISDEITKTPKGMRTFGDSMELADLKARKLAKQSKLLSLQINQVGVAALKAARGFLRFAGIVGAVVTAVSIVLEVFDFLKEKLGLINEEAEKLRENLKELSGGLDTATKDFERMGLRIDKIGIDFLTDKITILGNAASSISTDKLEETVALIKAGVSEQEKVMGKGGFLGSGIATGEFERVVSAESAEAAESLEKYLAAVGRVIPEIGRIAEGITDFTAVSDEDLQGISRAIELHKERLQIQTRISELGEEETRAVRQLASAYSATPIDKYLRILTESVDLQKQNLETLKQMALEDGIITQEEADQLGIAALRLKTSMETADVFRDLRQEEIANLDKINDLAIQQVKLQGKATLAARRQAALLSEKQAEVALEAKLLEIKTIEASVTESSTADEKRAAELAIQNLGREIALDEAKLELLRQQNNEFIQLRNNATQAFEGALQTSLKDIITGQTSSIKEAVVKIAQATLDGIATSLSQMMATRVSEALFGSKAQDMKNALTEGAQSIEDAIVRGAQKAAGTFSGDTTQETAQAAVSREGTQMSVFQRAKSYLFGGPSDRVRTASEGEGTIVEGRQVEGVFSRFVEGLKGLFSKDTPFLQSLGNIFAGGLEGFGTIFSDILGGLFGGGGGGGGLFGTLAKSALSLIPGVGGLAAMLPFKNGGISTPSGKVPGYAVGGIAKGPTQGYPAILHGTEAVVPLPNGKSIPVEPRGSMATNNVEINVNVDNQGNAETQTQMDDQQAGNLGRAISAAVQEELQRQKRPGGILSPFGAA